MITNRPEIKISVRSLVEFVLKSGDLDNTKARFDADAMQAGSRMHRKIQKQMGSHYSPEVALKIEVPLNRDGLEFALIIEGRADGIINHEQMEEETARLVFEEDEYNSPKITIDEIKGVYLDLNYLTEPVGVHKAQAMCYAYIYGLQNEQKSMGIRMTYCNLETENLKHFEDVYSMEELSSWFQDLVEEYGKWATWQIQWIAKRNEGVRSLEFPFEYRGGQKELVAGVYRTILRKKKLFIEAPTGVGKTISTVFPAVKAMGEGIAEKIFYLTAKTITRTVAEDTFGLLHQEGLAFKYVTITAKEKICVLDKPNCNPVACERAKGFYDRVNDAVFDLLTHENEITRELIESYAEKHCVCPFEMGLDVTLWADAIICDYNYIFDPNVYLRRFFGMNEKHEYVFLIDEAHNLVDRSREMYSAILIKDQFLEVNRLVKDRYKDLSKRLMQCNQDLLAMKRSGDDFSIHENINHFCAHLMSLMTELEIFLKEGHLNEGKDELLGLYMEIRHFLAMFEGMDEDYLIYTDFDEQDRFRIKLQCMDPSRLLRSYMYRGRSTVLFSATLLPIQYYKEQLGGTEEDYAVYAPSSFDTNNRLIMVAQDVSTKYSRRNEREYRKILNYIIDFTKGKLGNYMVFFPSYQMLQQIAELAGDTLPGIVVQSSFMTEQEKEEFLEGFVENPTESRIGFCVMGGIFSEGIDLKNNRLIGAVIVGTGLPMVCNERELFRGYFDERNGMGFDYAYLYQGMNKVLQSGGRVIRTKEDRGMILLLDDRFMQTQYYNLFPKEWFPFEVVDMDKMSQMVTDFWSMQ